MALLEGAECPLRARTAHCLQSLILQPVTEMEVKKLILGAAKVLCSSFTETANHVKFCINRFCGGIRG